MNHQVIASAIPSIKNNIRRVINSRSGSLTQAICEGLDFDQISMDRAVCVNKILFSELEKSLIQKAVSEVICEQSKILFHHYCEMDTKGKYDLVNSDSIKEILLKLKGVLIEGVIVVSNENVIPEPHRHPNFLEGVRIATNTPCNLCLLSQFHLNINYGDIRRYAVRQTA